jgi:chromosome segregation ATPase
VLATLAIGALSIALLTCGCCSKRTSKAPSSHKALDAATTKRVAELENQAALAREAQAQAEAALKDASAKLQEQREKISDLEAVKRRLTETQKRQQEALRSRPPSGASSEQLAALQAECEQLRAQAEADQAQLAAVAVERDSYLSNWQAAYAECLRLSEQAQVAQAPAPADVDSSTAAHPAAQGRASATAARLESEVQRLHEVVQARELELSQLRSMLATVVPDKEDDARELERERAHVQALTARCEQLNAQLQDKELRLQQLLLQQDHLAIDRDSLVAQMEKLTSLHTDASMPAAQAALHLALAAGEKKLHLLQERHGEMLRFHEKLRQTAEQKLETVKELYEERMHKMEAQLSEKAARIRAMEIDMARVHSPVLGAGDGSQQREADELRRWLYEAQQQAEKANKSLTMARQKITTQEAELQQIGRASCRERVCIGV